MFEITKIKYSKTITSLRGISILGVLLYHAKFDFFKGGYLGVDVFFVISGYLIGNIILSKLTTQTFFFKDFYIRRARRLLPALFASLFFTYVLNYFLLLPSDFEQFKNSIVYVLTFTGNIYFWNNTDYFSPSTDILSLSHLWSLGVEEQFYLLFPILLFIVFKNKLLKRYLKQFISLVIILSFLYNLFDFYHIPIDCPTTNCIEVTNFYWLHTRLWELMFGSILCFFKLNIFKKIKTQYVLLTGVALVLISFSFIDDTFRHPGIFTLPTILGTGLVIVSSTIQDENFLSNSKSMYILGKISYSLYLIHFPLFVIRNYFDFELKILNSLDVLPYLLIVVSIIIGYFMWKFIEEPFRQINNLTNKKFLITSSSIFVGLLILSSSLFPIKTQSNMEKNFIYDTDFQINRDCFFEIINTELLEDCLSTENNDEVLIIGSSIAQNIYKGLLENTEFEVNYVSIPGCPPLIDNYSKDILNFNEEKCEDFYRQVMKILKDNEYHKVLIVYDWSQLIFDKNLLTENLVIEMVDNFSVFAELDNLVIVGQPISWENQLRVLVSREVNIFNKSLAQYNNIYLVDNLFDSDIRMKEYVSQRGVSYYSLVDLFCTNKKCKLYEKLGNKYYFISPDYQHLTDYFSKKLAISLNNFLLEK